MYDEVFITAIVFGSFLACMKMWLNYRREKIQIKNSAPQESGMRASELSALIREAVEEALDDRMGPFEKRLLERDAGRLIPAAHDEPDTSDAARPQASLSAREPDAAR